MQIIIRRKKKPSPVPKIKQTSIAESRRELKKYVDLAVAPLPTRPHPNPKHDITGTKFHHFIAIGLFAYKKGYWVVQCTRCGRYQIKRTGNLKKITEKTCCRYCSFIKKEKVL